MTKKNKFLFILLIIAIASSVAVIKLRRKSSSDEVVKWISPVVGTIQTVISTTGTILPKNRLQVKPPVNGRIESILVKEGEQVKVGHPLAWMSSTERAALLDAARAKGEAAVKFWQEAYKPIILLAPIEGEVIVATTQPGQAVTTADAVIVLSDQLIARAQVDETDIGKIKLGQEAIVTLDAYPDTKINSKVEHIYYESKTVNNVTIYEVDLSAEELPSFFRSGMNAAIDFIEQRKENILLLPVEAVQKENNEDVVVFVKQDGAIDAARRVIKLGITDDKNWEILSGISVNDQIKVTTKKYSLPKGASGTNPFMPMRQPRSQAR